MRFILPSRLFLFVSAATLGCALVSLLGQQQPPRVSPQETVNAEVDGAKIKIVYSRPYTKDPKTGESRKVWGGLVPFGKVWRTGANEATLLTSDRPLVFGATTVPAGTYSLFTLPEESAGSKLIINKQTGQWGTKYDDKQDLARVDLKKESNDKAVDQFTVTITSKPADGGGVLTMAWETTQFSVPFTVKK